MSRHRCRSRRFSSLEGRQLTKDTRHKKLAGVCAGIAEYLDISRFCVRVATIISFCMLPHIVLMAYLAAYFILDDNGVRYQEYNGRRHYD